MATTAVMIHLVLLVYSYGDSISGMMVNRASRPRCSDLGTMAAVRAKMETRRDIGCESRLAEVSETALGNASRSSRWISLSLLSRFCHLLLCSDFLLSRDPFLSE